MDSCMCAQLVIHVHLFVTPWTVACQATLSMGFSRQEYWIRLLFASPGDLPDPGIKHWHAGPLPLSPTWEAQMDLYNVYNSVIFPRFTV